MSLSEAMSLESASGGTARDESLDPDAVRSHGSNGCSCTDPTTSETVRLGLPGTDV